MREPDLCPHSILGRKTEGTGGRGTVAIQPLGEEETENQAAYLPPADPVQRFKGDGLDTFDGDELNSPWSQCHQPSGPFGDCLRSGSSQGNKAMSTKFRGKMIFNLETCICAYDFKCEGRIKTFKVI